MTLTISCLDCNKSSNWEMEDSAFKAAVADGTIQEHVGIYGTKTYFAICDQCQAKHARAARKNRGDEFVLLRRTMARIREAQPEWTLEECSKAAVETINDPWQEVDPGFRRYLLEHDL